MIYGLGQSANDDQYIDEYKSLALEFSNGPGKLTNLNLIGGNPLGVTGDYLSANSTTMSASSSINSLNGSL